MKAANTWNDKIINRLSSERGLTLVEIVVVLVIVGFVFTFLVGKVFDTGEKAKAELNRTRMLSVKSAIQQFQLRYNTVPQSIDSLLRCTEETGSDCIPISKPEDLKDAWNTQFVYQKGNDNRSFTLTTLGADGKEGGDGVNKDLSISGP